MGNQRGSWWRTSGKPWCQNWLNAFTACWILRANVDEISSSIRYACISIIMGERYIFNDASSWFTEKYFMYNISSLTYFFSVQRTSTKLSYLIKKECWIKVHYFCKYFIVTLQFVDMRSKECWCIYLAIHLCSKLNCFINSNVRWKSFLTQVLIVIK